MKKFILGLITGLLLSTMTVSFAASKLTAYFNPDVKINIDGVPLKAEIVSVDETQKNYAPVRDVAEALGATVTWNQETKSIDIISKESEVSVVSNTAVNQVQYDYKTKLPINAEFVTYKNIENAVKYNDIIYISSDDFRAIGNFSYALIDTEKIVFQNRNNKDIFVTIDLTNKSNYFYNSIGVMYIKASLIEEYLEGK